MISVLIPVFNGERYLATAIESVLEQTLRDFEIVVVDDGSTDRTAEIARGYSGVRYVHQSHGGVSVARNRGIHEAHGDIIAFLDSDDVFVKDKLSKQFAYMATHSDCAVCYTRMTNVTEIAVDALSPRQRQVMNAHVENILPTACIRRRVFETCGYFDVSLLYGEDTEWITRVNLMMPGCFATLEEPLYVRRIHENNMSFSHESTGGANLGPIWAKSRMHSLMMKPGRKISVIIPAFNAERYLEDAVESVYRQNWLGELELIIVDNNSTDRTEEVARRYNCIVLNELQKGAAFARNKGIQAATGDFIVLLDADDYLADGSADALFARMYGVQPADAVFGKAVDFVSEELPDGEKAKLKARDGSYGGVLPGCSLIRKNVFERIGLFDTALSSGETIDWQMRLKDSGIPTAQVDFVVLNRRLHLTNTGRLAAQDERKNYAALLRKRMMMNRQKK